MGWILCLFSQVKSKSKLDQSRESDLCEKLVKEQRTVLCIAGVPTASIRGSLFINMY